MDYEKISDALVDWVKEEPEAPVSPVSLEECSFVEHKVWNLQNVRDSVWGDD